MGQATFQWVSFKTASFQAVASGANASVSMVSFADPSTIRRIVYDYQCIISAPADNAVGTGMFGLIVADKTAIDSGTTAIPKPFTDGDQEFLFVRGYGMQIEVLANSGGQLHSNVGHGDIRTMRKVKQRDEMIFMVENSSGTAIAIAIQGRLLVSI